MSLYEDNDGFDQLQDVKVVSKINNSTTSRKVGSISKPSKKLKEKKKATLINMMKKKGELFLTFNDYVLEENVEQATLILENPFLKLDNLNHLIAGDKMKSLFSKIGVSKITDMNGPGSDETKSLTRNPSDDPQN